MQKHLKADGRRQKRDLNRKFNKWIDKLEPFYANIQSQNFNFKIDQTILGIWEKDWERSIQGKFKKCIKN